MSIAMLMSISHINNLIKNSEKYDMYIKEFNTHIFRQVSILPLLARFPDHFWQSIGTFPYLPSLRSRSSVRDLPIQGAFHP